MLGIRHYKQVAIDLYQRDLSRDITDFVCDVMVRAAKTESLFEILTPTAQAKHRHVVIVPEPASALLQDAAAAMMVVKDYIDQVPGNQGAVAPGESQHIWPKRITWMFEDNTSYDLFQQALFETFPEIDAHE